MCMYVKRIDKMNQLIIIGNGFDLAHGLKTSYKDFILDLLSAEVSKPKGSKIYKEKDLIAIYDVYYATQPITFNSLDQYKDYIKRHNMKVQYNPFFGKTLEYCEKNNWVDIEKLYYRELQEILKNAVDNKVFELDQYYVDEVTELNKSLDLIKSALHNYLDKTYSIPEKCNSDIKLHIENIIHLSNENSYSSLQENTHILNFNYTPTINIYLESFKPYDSYLYYVNNIHGQLNDKDNPIIFGYGDETDEMYSKIEDFDENELTRNMKSFYYLRSLNYQRLFDFLDEGKFDVNVMGHSCGISDRVLFNSIFQHNNLNEILIYYYKWGESNEDNDFFEKTQNISRYFDMSSKHRMRTKIVPFTKCSPLTS